MILLVGLLVVSTTLAGGAMLTNFMAAAAVPGATSDVAVDATGSNVTVTHVGGDPIAEGDVAVIISGASGEKRYALTGDAIAREGDGDQWFETGERATFSHLFIGEIRVAVVDRGEQAVIFDEALTPAVVGDPADLSVTIDNTNSPIKENETLVVRSTIENAGDRTGVQTIELSVAGSVVDTQEVRLAGGTWEQVDLEWTPSDGDAGDYTITVSSQNDSDSAPVTVRTPSNFEVVIDNTSSPVNETEILHVNATITNSGEDSDVQVIPLNISSEPDPVDFVTVGLDQAESRSVTMNWSTLNGDAGTHVADVSTLDDSADTTVTVLDVDAPPYFAVTIDSTNSPVTAGEDLTVDATVENIGDQNGTQTISLDVTNQTNPVDSQSVPLQSGETTTVSLVWSTANNDWQDSPYTATVTSENTSDSAQVNVTKKSEAGPTADAGGPYTVESGGTEPLFGSGSTGTGTLSYTWSIVSGNGTLTGTNGETVEYQAPSVTSSETVTVELTVSDNKGSDTDQTTITVTPGDPPVVDDVTITSSGSGNSIDYTVDWNVSDPDGDLVNVTVQALDNKGTVIDTGSTTFTETARKTGSTILNGSNKVDTIRVIARDAEGLTAQNDTDVSNNNSGRGP